MSRLTILTEAEQNEFDHPPVLSTEAKALCFSNKNKSDITCGFFRY